MTTTPLNIIEAAKGKKMPTQAEYGVAFALNEKRFAMDNNHIDVEIPFECKKLGGYFYSTDQLGDHTFNDEGLKRSTEKGLFDNYNIKHDIDLVLSEAIVSHKQRGFFGRSLGISVKMMDKALFTNNISLEMKTFNPKTNESRDGWAITGKSHYSAFCLGTKFILVSTEEVKGLLKSQHSYRTLNLTPAVKQININQGRKFYDAENVLVPINDIKSLPSAQVLDMPQWYITKWRSKASEDVRSANDYRWSK